MKQPGNRFPINRRQFLASNAALGVFLFLQGIPAWSFAGMQAGKKALELKHFPNALYAFVWRNWGLVPLERMAAAVNATPQQLGQIARFMGLPPAPPVTDEQWQRSYLTVIRRNWHLLPDSQLQTLMGWDKARMDFTLKEDDFFYIKLGSLKPECAPVVYQQLAEIPAEGKQRFSRLLRQAFPKGLPKEQMPYFHFVKELSAPFKKEQMPGQAPSPAGFNPRLTYPYFALFGDPLLDTSIDSYPDAYLERLAASGVESIWMHIVLSRLTPFPWDPSVSQHWEQRLANLQKLSSRARAHGIGIYLYLNEPRHQPEAFYKKNPGLRGQGTALCTSNPEVQRYLEDSIAQIVERAPLIAGFFSITASENPTNCWSHGQGKGCSRCGPAGPGTVIAALNNTYSQGIRKGYEAAKAAGNMAADTVPPQLIIWDWGWRDDWAAAIIPQLITKDSLLMSVSEWELDIERGGIKSKVGEYSISAIGPGPRAKRHWKLAQEHGLKTMAKIQANNSWEIGAVPYIPALYNVAKHIERLRTEGVAGLMLGWTLGGYPSPNLEVVALMGSDKSLSSADAVQQVADRRFGAAAPVMTHAWRQFSEAFSKFPYHISVVYGAPLQVGPANLLWQAPTGYKATMVGLPYDDINGWRSIYPADVFTRLLRELGDTFAGIVQQLNEAAKKTALSQNERQAVLQERNIIEAIALHYRSIANQAEFIVCRDRLAAAATDRRSIKDRLAHLLMQETALAERMAALQISDSRLGFEASNQYFYTPADLYEKILNCRDLLEHWLPAVPD
ncbi:hypothetical protein [Niabella drilacis]|uniref:Uncharacterized protein n=1 Tax=Niabella drilacis (strain DSM 25811 / CCM 8410 / CCUG 62505 / LMG 26954 / E90) TaxID=1285928 RepID=A0A1G6S5B8_NIADE|nr:hypothetical protein [Niabella drilacis]SDD11337.1 hypothetical protein SAMN04487894_10676 [Niabella drilacis]